MPSQLGKLIITITDILVVLGLMKQEWWCWCDRDEVSKTPSWLKHSHGRHSRSPSWYWNFQNSRCCWWPSWSLTFEKEKVGWTSLRTYCSTFQRGVWAWHRSLEEHTILQTNTVKQTLKKLCLMFLFLFTTL